MTYNSIIKKSEKKGSDKVASDETSKQIPEANHKKNRISSS